MSAIDSKKISQFKTKLIKETYHLKHFIHKNNICFECEPWKWNILPSILQLEAFFIGKMSKLNAQNKYLSQNRDKSKYFCLTLIIKTFPGHHLPITYLQLKVKGNETLVLNLQLNFQKGRLDRTSLIRRGCWERGGWLFSGEGCNVYKENKNKLKSELSNDKKVYHQKCFINKNVFLCQNQEFKLGNFN